MGNVSFCAYDPILRVLTELNIMIFCEGMPTNNKITEVRLSGHIPVTGKNRKFSASYKSHLPDFPWFPKKK